jgi:hypothetical protein
MYGNRASGLLEEPSINRPTIRLWAGVPAPLRRHGFHHNQSIRQVWRRETGTLPGPLPARSPRLGFLLFMIAWFNGSGEQDLGPCKLDQACDPRCFSDDELGDLR